MGKKRAANWERLKDLALDWVDETLQRLGREQPNILERDQLFYRTAETCIMSMREYVETAFEAFVAHRFHSGLTCCRTVFEVGVHLLWCAQDKTGSERRPAQVYKKLLDEDYKFYNHAARVFPKEPGGTDWEGAAREVKEQRDQLCADASVPKMESMIRSIEKESQGKLAFRSLYPAVYRIYEKLSIVGVNKLFAVSSFFKNQEYRFHFFVWIVVGQQIHSST